MLRRFSPLFAAALLAGCIDATGPAPERAAPQFDHVTPPTPPTEITINNYDVVFHWNGLETFYRDHSALFTGGIAYGTSESDVHVVNTALGGFDITETGLPVDVLAPGAVADHQSATVLTEAPGQTYGPKAPIGITTVRETFAWAAAPDDDFVIVRYSLTNNTSAPIGNLHVGYMSDPDFDDPVTTAFDYMNNIAFYDAATQSARIRNGAGNAQHGIILLDRPVAAYVGWTNGTATSVFPNRDPQSNAQWWSIVSGAVNSTTFGPADVRQYLGAAPISIAPGATEVVTFALLAGDNAADLTANITAARAKSPLLAGSRSGIRTPVAIQPGLTRWTARITFPSTGAANSFVASQARCGGAPLVDAAVSGTYVDVAVDALALDSRTRSGQPMYCSGRLANGTYFAGVDYPVFDDGTITARRVTNTALAENHPTYSADGSRIAVSVLGATAPGIYTVDAAGTTAPVRVTTFGQQPSWHPNGTKIAFAAGRIYTVDLATGITVQLPGVGTNNSDPRYSPDGNEIAFRKGAELWLMNADGTNQRKIAFSGTQNSYPEWSGDGSRIYYTSFNPDGPDTGEGIFWLSPAVSGPATRVTPSEASQFRFGDIASDGKTLLFMNGGSIVFQDIQSGLHTVAKLAVGASPANLPNVEFSPDNTKVLYAGGNGEVYEFTIPAPETPAERAAQLTASVSSLVADGLLSAADGAQLSDKLTQVSEMIAQGSVNAAINHVGAFINKVNALVNSRRLNHITGTQLTSEATYLVTQLEAHGG